MHSVGRRAAGPRLGPAWYDGPAVHAGQLPRSHSDLSFVHHFLPGTIIDAVNSGNPADIEGVSRLGGSPARAWWGFILCGKGCIGGERHACTITCPTSCCNRHLACAPTIAAGLRSSWKLPMQWASLCACPWQASGECELVVVQGCRLWLSPAPRSAIPPLSHAPRHLTISQWPPTTCSDRPGHRRSQRRALLPHHRPCACQLQPWQEQRQRWKHWWGWILGLERLRVQQRGKGAPPAASLDRACAASTPEDRRVCPAVLQAMFVGNLSARKTPPTGGLKLVQSSLMWDTTACRCLAAAPIMW